MNWRRCCAWLGACNEAGFVGMWMRSCEAAEVHLTVSCASFCLFFLSSFYKVEQVCNIKGTFLCFDDASRFR